ncbi:MAG TPA: ABC transporter transmembrane domain-containing protein, partial [Actinomycetospora sp.]|nr:ABC transporter transmembrane domain-containing protein [Actinomycetospora sp.]
MAAHPRTYVAAVGLSAVFGASTVAVSQVLGQVTDRVVVPALAGDPDGRARIGLAGLALVAVALVLALGVAGRRIFAGIGYSDIGADHRRGVTRQYVRLPMSWHRAHPTGQLLANASSDVEAATGVFNPLPFALGVVVMIGVAAVALVVVDVWLAVTAFTVLPLAVLANVVFQRFMTPAVTRAQQLRAHVSDVAHESFEAALLVKSLGTADREEARFAARADELAAANVRVGQVRAVFDPVIELLPAAGTLAVLLVGAHRAAAGAVQAGDIVSAAYLLTLMAVPVRAFGWVLGALPRALVGYDRIARVLDARADMTPGERPLPRGERGLQVEL